MDQAINTYSDVTAGLGEAIYKNATDKQSSQEIKKQILHSYEHWANWVNPRSFLNWGLWDWPLYLEYKNLKFPFTKLCPNQDIYAHLLLYQLIRPLKQIEFYRKTLLDVGCGTGVGLRCASKLLKTKQAIGMDLVPQFAKSANKEFYREGRRHFISGDAEALPFQDNSFDIITNLESSHLYPNLEHFYKEVFRVLKPGGFFCYADIYCDHRNQTGVLENLIKVEKNAAIIINKNLTKLVQNSIYRRIVKQEYLFLQNAHLTLSHEDFSKELLAMANAQGLSFLPHWWIRFRNPELKQLAKTIKSTPYWGGTKYFFYYLIQKAI